MILLLDVNGSSYVDSDDESDNGINNATLLFCTSEVQKIIKNTQSYLDGNICEVINKIIDDLKQLVDNMEFEKTSFFVFLIFFPKMIFFTCFLS